jgi:hypothetical protein
MGFILDIILNAKCLMPNFFSRPTSHPFLRRPVPVVYKYKDIAVIYLANKGLGETGK